MIVDYLFIFKFLPLSVCLFATDGLVAENFVIYFLSSIRWECLVHQTKAPLEFGDHLK